MKASRVRSDAGFTPGEVLVLAAVFFLLVTLFLLLPLMNSNRPPRGFYCLSNLKQIGLAMQMYCQDYNGNYLRTSQAAAEDATSLPAANAVLLDRYVGRSTRIWICPTETSKTAATNYDTFDNRNTSYFLSLDASREVTNMIFAGDRHLRSGTGSLGGTIFQVTRSSSLGWTRELHKNSRRPMGALLFSGGYVEFKFATTNFAATLSRGPVGANRLAVP